MSFNPATDCTISGRRREAESEMGSMMRTPEELRAEILRLTREYSSQVHGAQRPGDQPRSEFKPGETVIPYAGRVFTEDEVEAGVGSMLDFWLTLGDHGEEFERLLADLDRKSTRLNSSHAN